MDTINQLKRLIEDARVPLIVMAEFCHCSPTSIRNYIIGTSLPSGSKILAIQEGMKKYKEIIESIFSE